MVRASSSAGGAVFPRTVSRYVAAPASAGYVVPVIAVLLLSVDLPRRRTADMDIDRPSISERDLGRRFLGTLWFRHGSSRAAPAVSGGSRSARGGRAQPLGGRAGLPASRWRVVSSRGAPPHR